MSFDDFTVDVEVASEHDQFGGDLDSGQQRLLRTTHHLHADEVVDDGSRNGLTIGELDGQQLRDVGDHAEVALEVGVEVPRQHHQLRAEVALHRDGRSARAIVDHDHRSVDRGVRQDRSEDVLALSEPIAVASFLTGSSRSRRIEREPRCSDHVARGKARQEGARQFGLGVGHGL